MLALLNSSLPPDDTSDEPTMEEIEECERNIEQLREQMKTAVSESAECLLSDLFTSSSSNSNLQVPQYEPQCRQVFSRHVSKIQALYWFPHNDHFISAAQDGKIYVWQSFSGKQVDQVLLKSAWVQTCCVSGSGCLVAHGGLDHTLSIHKLVVDSAHCSPADIEKKPLLCELIGHEAFVSSSRFLVNDENSIISASGDSTCFLWDVSKSTMKQKFLGHKEDVMCVALPGDGQPYVFASAGVDGTAKIWDIRAADSCCIDFQAHQCDINALAWFRDDKAVLTGSDDTMVKLMDIRSCRQLCEYYKKPGTISGPSETASVAGVDVSASGQYIFSAHDDGNVVMWSTLESKAIANLEHEARVSCLAVSNDGYALVTGCWDFCLRTFA